VRYSAEEKMRHFLIASELREALPGWFSGGLQDIRKQDSLAKTVHGSGLLLALGLGLTGLIIFFEISPEGSIGALGHAALGACRTYDKSTARQGQRSKNLRIFVA